MASGEMGIGALEARCRGAAATGGAAASKSREKAEDGTSSVFRDRSRWGRGIGGVSGFVVGRVFGGSRWRRNERDGDECICVKIVCLPEPSQQTKTTKRWRCLPVAHVKQTWTFFLLAILLVAVLVLAI